MLVSTVVGIHIRILRIIRALRVNACMIVASSSFRYFVSVFVRNCGLLCLIGGNQRSTRKQLFWAVCDRIPDLSMCSRVIVPCAVPEYLIAGLLCLSTKMQCSTFTQRKISALEFLFHINDCIFCQFLVCTCRTHSMTLCFTVLYFQFHAIVLRDRFPTSTVQYMYVRRSTILRTADMKHKASTVQYFF